MSKNVNVVISDFANLGTTVPVPQYSVSIDIDWRVNNGVLNTHSATKTFPNVLSGIPANRLKKYLRIIVLSELRIELGIDGDVIE